MKKNYLVLSVVCSAILLSACNQSKAPENPAEKVETQQPAVQNTTNDAAASEVVNDGPIQQFTAYGVTQSWRVLVDDDQIEVEGTALPNFKIPVERSAYAKGVEFMGQHDNKAVNVNINSTPCKDADGTMAEFSVTLDYGDQVFKGCAVAGIVPTADT
ncbi:hypothetical protein VXO75_04870 [Acinetobacter towneri]|uniref:hypothetical protein n=1 Tax=Acinetobacter towneri TaxID=202956 RepID=UPI003A8AC4E9